MRTLEDFFALSIIAVITGTGLALAGYFWGGQIKLLEYSQPYAILIAGAGFVAACFIGIELLRRRFP